MRTTSRSVSSLGGLSKRVLSGPDGRGGCGRHRSYHPAAAPGSGTRVAAPPPRRSPVEPQSWTETRAVADRDEPPFEGGSQPVKQVPPDVPPGRPSAMPVVMGVL